MNFPFFSVDDIIRQLCPTARLGILLQAVKVAPAGPDLLELIQKQLAAVQEKMGVEDIHRLPPLHAARGAYRALGKDPSRYRPSAEALLRRVVQGKGLYPLNNAVDALNLVSVKTGFSIGGYDAEKITGEVLFGRGEDGEPYEAIGRGILNIENLPVLRDRMGAFGSPTSDSQRTMVSEQTRYFLVVFFDFGREYGLVEAMDKLENLLMDHAAGQPVERAIWDAG